MNDLHKDRPSFKPLTRGDFMALSDEELRQVIADDVPTLPPGCDIPASIFERRDRARSARAEQLRRIGLDRKPDQDRMRVQMQTGTPSGKVGTMRPSTSSAATQRPLSEMSVEALQQIQAQALDETARNASPVAVTPGTEATRELFRRATTPATATPVNPTNWR